MSELQNQIALFGKPYAITRSKLGAITKIFDDRYICDLRALKEIFQSIGEKLSRSGSVATPTFSFLISFDDKTHHDGITADFQNLTTIPTGKLTDRIVMRWGITHLLNEEENELSVTIRISNPINPLVFLQAALSKSPNELDNTEFELGSTCVTVDGSTQAYADEIFLLVKNWVAARNKPHAFIEVRKVYDKVEWYADQFNRSLLPTLVVAGLSFWSLERFSTNTLIASIPITFGIFFFIRSIGDDLNRKMLIWARKTEHMGVFQITNGDIDSVAKMAARAKNSALKLIATNAMSLVSNIIAGVVCWYLLPK